MIDINTFTKKHIQNIKEQYPSLDQFIIERTIFAFGLLEALVRVDTPFVFKGGTSLILLLEQPYRLSTDVDIVVEPTTKIHKYLEAAAKIFPFIRMEDQVRKGKNNIIKEHFKFYYQSPSTDNEIPILLDVLYEKHGYSKIIEKEIKNEFLITTGKPTKVKTPSVESILGDKLTAFAPNTTGIEYEYTNKHGVLVKKHLEVIKQFLDVAKLIESAIDFYEINDSYCEVVKHEIAYRGLAIKKEDVLLDTFNTALSIISRGTINKKDFPYLHSGIRRIQNHVYGIKVNVESVTQYAANVMLLTAKLITYTEKININQKALIKVKAFKSINRLKKTDPDSFNVAVTALELLKYV